MRQANPGLQVLAFLNRADSRGQDNQEAMAVLRASDQLVTLDARIGNRKAFPDAAAKGMVVEELRPANVLANHKILTLYRYLFDINLRSEQDQKEIIA
jgi:chromosome partitioning protein